MARPEPINATQAHSKAKVSLYFSDPLFVAGEHVSGKMELECKAERGLGIGDIKVELFAIQELTSRDHSATNTFLHLTRYFQGPGLPPSNAVHPHPMPGNDSVLPVDHYLARKGTTTFFFRFPLPASSPASIDFGQGLAKLKYEARASVGVVWRGERQRVMERQEVSIVEAPGDGGEEVEGIVVGENGKIWAQGRVLNPYVVAGRDACVELFVKNHSNKRTSSLSLSLTRRLNLPAVSQIHKSLQLSDVLTTIPFRGPEYIVQPGTEGIANLVFSIPKNAQGVRSGRLETGEEDEGREEVESLFDVRCVIEVKIGMGFGSKDVVLELPVTIYHPTTTRLLPLPAPLPVLPEPPQRLYSPPAHVVSPYQSPPFSPTYDPAYSTAYISPPMSPPILHPNHPAPVWSPPPQVISPPPQMMHEQYYYYPPPPRNYAHAARPSSADPFVSRPLPSLPIQNSNPYISASACAPGVSPYGANTAVTAPNFVSGDRPEEGEPGKGERASRIAAHLRMSSRNRSVSPQSRRFPQPQPAFAPATDLASAFPAQLQAPPPPSMGPGVGVEFPRTGTSPVTQNHEVLSPRPVLTPKQSFSYDRGTVKSDHVIGLERMVAEQVDEAQKITGPGLQRNKTLPPEPVIAPTDGEPPDTPRLPPEPTLLPIPTRPRPEIWNRESGLAALERKLLEQVGTRKPDTEGRERRVDVRSVLPEPIKIPAHNDPRCDPPNDSAISSLALGADISFDNVPRPLPLRLDDDDDALAKSPPSPPTTQKPVREMKKDKSPDRRAAVNGREKKKRNHANHLREAATGRIAAWLGGLDSASPPEAIQTPPFSSPAIIVQELPSPIDVDPHPLLRSPAVPNPAPAPDMSDDSDDINHDTIPTRSSGFVLHATKDTSSFEPPPPNSEDEPIGQSSLLNGAASSSKTPTMTSPPTKPVLRRFAGFPNKAQHLEHKYDIRSARGGRGGKVTSVAALWDSLASQQEPLSNPVQRAEKAGTFSPTFKDTARPKTSPKKYNPTKTSPNKHSPTKTSPHNKKRHEDTNGTNVDNLTARRARMVKATSVPAVVSSSLATPVLSSTASLTRPIEAEYPKRSYPPTHTTFTITEQPQAESSPPRTQTQLAKSSPTANDLAFGQARLKDLIKKYQQGFGQ